MADSIVPIGEFSGDAGSAIGGVDNPRAVTFRVGGLNTSSAFACNFGDAHSLIKEGTGTFTLSGTHTSTGSISVSNGLLALVADAELTNSSGIRVASPGILDVSGRADGTLWVGSVAQTIAGNGTIRGSLTMGGLGTLAPGFSIGTLTVTNALTLGGTNIMEIDPTGSPNSDRLVAASIAYGGVLTVTALRSPVGGETFQLFSGAISGTFGAISLPTLATGLSWDTSSLNSAGTLHVNGTVIPPQIGSIARSGTTSVISGTGGTAGTTYQVLTTTDVALPLSSWTVLGSGTFAGDGSYSFTDSAATNVVQFYRVSWVP
jgi:autotransporter-associated beta strand protein